MACPVWFHFTSARPRDGLASFASRSLTSASRPSSFLVHPALFSSPFSSFFSFSSSCSVSYRYCGSSSLCPPARVLPSDLWAAENWPKRSRKNRRPVRSSSLVSAISFRLLFLFFVVYIFCVCVRWASILSCKRKRERERDHLFSECLTATSLITSGLDSCGYGQESPGETRDLRRRAWEASAWIPEFRIFMIVSLNSLASPSFSIQFFILRWC